MGRCPGWREHRPDFRLDSFLLVCLSNRQHFISVRQQWVMFIVNVAEETKKINPLHTRLFSLSLFLLWNIVLHKNRTAEELSLHVLGFGIHNNSYWADYLVITITLVIWMLQSKMTLCYSEALVHVSQLRNGYISISIVDFKGCQSNQIIDLLSDTP